MLKKQKSHICLKFFTLGDFEYLNNPVKRENFF